MKYSDVSRIMASLDPGQFVYVETASRDDCTKVSRLLTQVKARSHALAGARFSTSQGVAVLSGEPVYIVRISRDT